MCIVYLTPRERERESAPERERELLYIIGLH